MTKWLVITAMACTLTVCGSPSYAKDYLANKSSYITLQQANGVAEVECVKQSGGVYKCQEY